MKIRLYLDEDSMSRGLTRALRSRGVDVITALDAGMIEQDDADHLDFATQQGRVLCSFAVLFSWGADASLAQVDSDQVGG